MASMRKSYPVPGGSLSVVHFGDVSRPLDMLFLHANGFHGLAYRSLLAPLAQETGAHIGAVDLRGHGLTDLPIDPDNLNNWKCFEDDILAFLSEHVDAPIAIAGHSLGAVISLLVAARAPQKIKALTCFDPVYIPQPLRAATYFKWGRKLLIGKLALTRNAAKRRAIFDSREAAFKRYRGRGPFKGVPDDALLDYLEAGLMECDDGVKLSCEPDWEAAIYVAQARNIFKAAKRAPAHSAIVLASAFGPAAPSMQKKISGIVGAQNVEKHEARTHFFPLQDPDFARQYLRAALNVK
jgi:pimeloyl-ACP methyl ester carboxylesterase